MEVPGLGGLAVPGNDKPSLGPGGTRSVVLADNRSEVREFLTSRWPQRRRGRPGCRGRRSRSAGPRRDESTLLAAAGYDAPGTGHLLPKGMR